MIGNQTIERRSGLDKIDSNSKYSSFLLSKQVLGNIEVSHSGYRSQILELQSFVLGHLEHLADSRIQGT